VVRRKPLPITPYRKASIESHSTPCSHVVQRTNPCNYRGWGRGVLSDHRIDLTLKWRRDLLETVYHYSLYKIKFKAMSIRRVTFVLLFDDSDESDSSEDDYDSDFENTPDLDK
jgi:hypothetical protein